MANGGFNQYFFNPGSAHVGATINTYERLGQPGWAEVIHDPVVVAGGEEGLREAHRDGTIDSFFATDDESQLDTFDERFDQIPWGDELRMELVRANPED